MVFHEITETRSRGRSTRRGASTSGSWTRRRRAGSSTASTATRCRPVLWKKVTRGLSAGRVQSVATRLVVERERERMAFVSAGYWDLTATFDPGAFEARLVAVDGSRVAQGRDFAPDGKLRDETLVRLDEDAARALAASLEKARVPRRLASTRSRTGASRPLRSGRRRCSRRRAGSCRFSAQTTMRVAQRLYESGYITYMRTDSTTLSESALDAARAQDAELFGEDFVPAKPRRYGRAVANAQEAHEAIRAGRGHVPHADRTSRASSAGTSTRSTTSSGSGRSRRRWRTRAGRRCRSGSRATSVRRDDAEFGASGTVITFRGFLAAYEPGRDEPADDDEERSPPAARPSGRRSRCGALEPEGHATMPPPRYTEPTLVRALEERGIGRPVDLRGDPLDDRRPRLRLQEGDGARADVRRVRGREPPRAPLRAARRLRLHRADGGRPRPDRRGRRGARRLAAAVLLRRRGRSRVCTTSSPITWTRSTRAP